MHSKRVSMYVCFVDISLLLFFCLVYHSMHISCLLQFRKDMFVFFVRAVTCRALLVKRWIVVGCE